MAGGRWQKRKMEKSIHRENNQAEQKQNSPTCQNIRKQTNIIQKKDNNNKGNNSLISRNIKQHLR